MEYPSFHPKVLVHVAKSNFLLGILFVQYILYCLEQFLPIRIFLFMNVWKNMVQIIKLKKHTGRSSIYNRKGSLFRG